jgi:hypothetical protein
MPGIVTDDDNVNAYQVRYQDDCEQWTEMNLEAGIVSLTVLLWSLLGELKKTL